MHLLIGAAFSAIRPLFLRGTTVSVRPMPRRSPPPTAAPKRLCAG
jgi:hypothetical protein